jgi:hypothetical protein
MSKAGKYYVHEEIPQVREILKTSLIYHDRKTQVPKRVIELLQLKPGVSRIVWVAEGGKICVESAKQTTTRV